MAEQISKEQLDSNEEGMLAPPSVGVGRMGRYAPLLSPNPVEFFTTYKLTYRCKHCGKEWSKTRTEEREIARSDAGPEQASSAEVAQEDEMDKEERYSEE